MNITVSLQELRDHETNIRAWFLERSLVFLKSISLTRVTNGGSFTCEDDARVYHNLGMKAVTEWEKEHPQPKLIPAV